MSVAPQSASALAERALSQNIGFADENLTQWRNGAKARRGGEMGNGGVKQGLAD